MKKMILGIIIGICLTLVFQYGRRYITYYGHKDDIAVFQLAKEYIERTMEDIKVLDVSHSPSQAKVNYVYDKLYDVTINYERDGKMKKIVTQIGISKGTWITPTKTDLEILDDKAKIIYERRK